MIYQTMIDAFILQGYLSRHVELSRNMMDKNKAMHYEFKLPYSRKQKHVSISDMSRVLTPPKT